jgi:predicted  nucleic acid-binding Zn-ribbon protein
MSGECDYYAFYSDHTRTALISELIQQAEQHKKEIKDLVEEHEKEIKVLNNKIEKLEIENGVEIRVTDWRIRQLLDEIAILKGRIRQLLDEIAILKGEKPI